MKHMTARQGRMPGSMTRSIRDVLILAALTWKNGLCTDDFVLELEWVTGWEHSRGGLYGTLVRLRRAGLIKVIHKGRQGVLRRIGQFPAGDKIDRQTKRYTITPRGQQRLRLFQDVFETIVRPALRHAG